MKKIRNLLLIILFICPFIVKADEIDLDYSYDRLAKLGGEAQYTFSVGTGEYEYYIEYDKQYLKFEKYEGVSYQEICGGNQDNITAKDNNGKITIKGEEDGCNSGITLFFTPLKEGTTKLKVLEGNIKFSGKRIDISTEIIDGNKKCEKCPEVKECEKCEKCPELNESSNNSSNNIVLYVVLGVLVILNIVTFIFTLKSNKLNKKSTE